MPVMMEILRMEMGAANSVILSQDGTAMLTMDRKINASYYLNHQFST
jgi:hypothetical protein